MDFFKPENSKPTIVRRGAYRAPYPHEMRQGTVEELRAVELKFARYVHSLGLKVNFDHFPHISEEDLI